LFLTAGYFWGTEEEEGGGTKVLCHFSQVLSNKKLFIIGGNCVQLFGGYVEK
jgi:hypothetical protein